jgi:hypothetical protein
MLYECDEGNCSIGREKCKNRSFTDLQERRKAGGKYRIGVEVIKTEDRGYGVRSNRCFEANQIITEYTGEIITEAECDRRMNEDYKNNAVSLIHLSVKVHELMLLALVLLPNVFRPEYYFGCYREGFYCTFCQPLLRTQLPHGEVGCGRKTTHGTLCRGSSHNDWR